MNIKSILSRLSVCAIAVAFSIGIAGCDSKPKREPQRAAKGAILYWGAPASAMWSNQRKAKERERLERLKELIEKLPQPVAAPAK